MKLFQIEEPDGSPAGDGPGAAIGVDLTEASGTGALLAVSVGGNAELLRGRDDGLERYVVEADVPAVDALRALRARAERALSRPVTHVVVAAPVSRHPALAAAADAAGLAVRLVTAEDALAAAPQIAFGTAILAEDMAREAR